MWNDDAEEWVLAHIQKCHDEKAFKIFILQFIQVQYRNSSPDLPFKLVITL